MRKNSLHILEYNCKRNIEKEMKRAIDLWKGYCLTSNKKEDVLKGILLSFIKRQKH
jgi:hypothetical protein